MSIIDNGLRNSSTKHKQLNKKKKKQKQEKRKKNTFFP